MKGYWVIRTYLSGKVGEKIKFFVPGERPTRSERRMKALAKKQEQNAAAAVRQLARLINANFAAGDLLLGLDYSDEGMERLRKAAGEMQGDDEDELLTEAAERELQNCLRRVKYAMKKDGRELRYIAMTSDTDGDTGERVRVHHHLLVPKGTEKAFLKAWQEYGLGGVDWSALRKQDDYTPVAEYLLRQVRRQRNRDAYTSSRNLCRPQAKDRIVLSAAEVRVPKGGTLLYRSAYQPGQAQYVRYVMPEGSFERLKL